MKQNIVEKVNLQKPKISEQLQSEYPHNILFTIKLKIISENEHPFLPILR